MVSTKQIHLFLYILIAWSLAVAQPLMTLFAEQPVFFIAHEIRGWSFILVTLIINLLVPIILWIALSFIGLLSHFLKEWLSRLIICIFLFFFFLPFFNTLQREVVYVLGIMFSIITMYCLVKFTLVKTFAQWFSVASFAFIFIFLFVSSTKQLLPNKIVSNENIFSQADGPVFIFVLDEFPLLSLLKSKNQIDETRFPTFASLTKNAIWYPNAKSISSATNIALPAILSGVKPSNPLKAGIFEQYPNNLFTYLSNTHSMNVIENTTRMCPGYLCKSIIKDKYQILLEDVFVSYQHYVYPNDMKHKLPAINNRWIGYMRELKNEKKKGFDFSERLDKFNNFIASFDQYPENTLHLLHVLLPHAPWRVLPDLKLYGFYEKEGVAGELIHADKNKYSAPHQWGNDQWATQLSWSRHLLQIGAMDSLLGNAIEKIKSQGLYDKSTIIVLADHGTSFIPSISRRYAQDENIPDIAAIPLFIKYPNQREGKVDLRIANNLDVLPTLMDLFKITPIDKVDGVSLIATQQREQELSLTQEGNAILDLPENYQTLFNKHVDDKNKMFPGNGWKGVYQSHDKNVVYGQKTNLLNIRKTRENAIKLQNANLFNNIDSSGKYIPAYYRIQYLLANPDFDQVLISVNGEIVSHCYFFVHANKDCAGLIDPESFNMNTENKNLNIRFFAVINEEKNLVVDELLLEEKNQASLQSTNKGDLIVFENGDSLAINSEGPPYGNITMRLAESDSIYMLDGWAADTYDGRIAEKILVFIDNKLFTTTNVGVPKKYLHTKYGHESLIDSGFQVSIPVSQFPNIQDHTIKVFANLNDSETTELFYVAKQNKLLNKSFASQKRRKTPVNPRAILAKKLENMDLNKISNITTIDAFNEDFKLLSAGDWHKIAKNKRWLGANLFIIMPVSKDVKSLKLDIKAKPLLKEGVVDSQKINIYIDDKFNQSFEINKYSSHTIKLDIETSPENGMITIMLEMPNAITPSSIGLSNDNRNLSLYLSSFTITPIKNKIKL